MPNANGRNMSCYLSATGPVHLQFVPQLREYKAVIDVNPSFGEAHSNLAVVYLVTGRIDEADTAVKTAEKAGFKANPRLKDDIAAAKKKSRLD